MENYLEQLHCQKTVFSAFHNSKSTQMVSEALKQHVALDKQVERENDPAGYNLCAATKYHPTVKEKARMDSEIGEHLVCESNFNCAKRHLLNHFSDYISQLGNLLNITSEHPETAMMEFKQAYQPSQLNEAALRSLRMTARKQVV
jgi:hypothetical protein